MIATVRDAVYKREKVGGTPALGGGGYQDVLVDAGIDDKRALFVEGEFGSVLASMRRDGNNLESKLRDAWDCLDVIQSNSKNNPSRTTEAHIALIAHITSAELRRRFSDESAANGFGNRVLWLCAKRSKYLPHGGAIHTVDFGDVDCQLRQAVAFARMEFEEDAVPLVLDPAAKRLWEEVYRSLSDPKPGLLGSITSRAEAQAKRLACLYALLDCSTWIRLHHLEAGLSLWKYCEQSAAYIFGDSLGDPDAEKLMAALDKAGKDGLGLYEIRRKVFCGHRTSEQIARLLTSLSHAGAAFMEPDTSTKRPSTRWFSVQVSRHRQAPES